MSIDVLTDERIKHYDVVTLIPVSQKWHVHLKLREIDGWLTPVHHAHLPSTIPRPLTFAVHNNPVISSREHRKSTRMEVFTLSVVTSVFSQSELQIEK